MNNTINRILRQYEANKKYYSSINLSNIMSMMIIKRVIIDSDDGSTIDALIYYHYYILLGILNKENQYGTYC